MITSRESLVGPPPPPPAQPPSQPAHHLILEEIICKEKLWCCVPGVEGGGSACGKVCSQSQPDGSSDSILLL